MKAHVPRDEEFVGFGLVSVPMPSVIDYEQVGSGWAVVIVHKIGNRFVQLSLRTLRRVA